MGTSSTPDGPSDRPGLLPDWATLPNDEAVSEDGTPEQDDAAVEDSESQDALPSEPITPRQSEPLWRTAKTNMTRWAGSRGGTGRLGAASNAYVASRGGARAAASSARSGRQASSRLGSFLGSVASRGLSETLRDIGLSDLIGKDAETVLAGICDRLVPAGNTKEEAAARRSVNEVLEDLFVQHIEETGDVAALERLDDTAIATAVEKSIIEYVFHRWLDDLGKSIEKGAVSENQAVELEQQVRQYVRNAVVLALDGRDVVHTRWVAGEGQRVVDGIYRDVYGILEASQ